MPAVGQSDTRETPPTSITVRAVSHDAKIIGSNVGGARIVIRNAATGEVLADGVQEGSTGNTTRIMVAPAHRDSARYDTEGSARFVADLAIAEPTVVDIEAFAPLGTPASMMRSSKRMLVVPGQHVTGEGIILELNGFTVELIEATAATGRITIGARVTMLCGCPTEPGGMWNSNDITIRAYLESAGRTVQMKKMAYAGRTSEYAATFEGVPSGVYDVRIVASDSGKGNFGMTTGIAVAP
ncbi:MAG: hypothetical protein KJO98_13855 [Rhodothermia bacterium]|nr:hypothetical protein [Rhodothermia bacterium]